MEKNLFDRKFFRASSYKLLAECFYQPDIENFQNLIKEYSEIENETVKMILFHFPTDANLLDELKVDHAKLFVGPFKMLSPPYGSVYLEKNQSLLGDSTMDVRQKYQDEGLEITLKEIPDHISIELEFMYYLLTKEMEFISLGQQEEANSFRIKQTQFMKRHLGKWVGEFCHNIKQHAESDFYKQVADLMISFVDSEIECLAYGGSA